MDPLTGKLYPSLEEAKKANVRNPVLIEMQDGLDSDTTPQHCAEPVHASPIRKSY